MAFGVGDELSVKLSASTASFTSSMEVAQSRLGELADEAANAAGSLQFLQGRADEAGDEMAAAGRKGSIASAGMSAFSIGTDGASVSVIGLSSALTLSLIPALATLTGAFAPLIVAMGGLASVAGSIGFASIAAGAGAVATNTEQLKDAFMDIVQTIQSEFAPVFDYATGLLIRLSNIFEDTISELVPSQSVIEAIGTEFLNLGRSIIQTLPAFTELAVALTSEFLPPFVDFMQDILPDLPGLIEGMVDEFKSVLPVLTGFAELMLELAPRVLEFGRQALPVVSGALGRIGGVLNTATRAFNELDSGLQDLLLKGSLVAPVITGIASVLSGLSTPVLAVVGAIAGLAAAWQTNFGNIRGVLRSLAQDLKSVLGNTLPTLINNTKQIIRAVLPVVEPVFRLLTRYIGTALINSIDLAVSSLTALSQLLTGDFAGAFETVEGLIDRVFARSLAVTLDFVGGVRDAFGGVLRFLIQSATDALNTTYNAFQTAFNGILMVVEDIAESIVGTFTEGLNGVIRQINEAIDLASGAVPGFNMQTFSTVASPDLNLASGTQRQERVVVEERQEIEFSGDGEISEMFARQANDQFSQQRRRDERDLGARLPDS